jgi:hypothetical protein
LFYKKAHPSYGFPQKVRKNEDDWASLAIDLQKRLEAVQEAVDGKPPNAALQDLVSKYSE